MLALRFLPSLDHEMWGEAANAESGKKPLPPSIIPVPPPCASGTFILGDEGRLENSPSLRRGRESEHFFPFFSGNEERNDFQRQKMAVREGEMEEEEASPPSSKREKLSSSSAANVMLEMRKGGGDGRRRKQPPPPSAIVRKERKTRCCSSSGNFSVTGVGDLPSE